MRIGFDAKRVFQNKSGLGNYSRSSLEIMQKFYPENEYVLFTPSQKNNARFQTSHGTKIILPEGGHKFFSSFWRSCMQSGDIKRSGVKIFHGLSNEIPMDISSSGKVKSVVTMHDLIFVRFPHLYPITDRILYNFKYRSSCNRADRIIAISQQTKDDLVNFWNINPDKIEVVYQGYNPIFDIKATAEEKTAVKEKYNLPDNFILSVGTVEERKNQMLAVKAIADYNIDANLVICGRETPYANTIREFVHQHKIEDKIHFISNIQSGELPALYQQSDIVSYTSVYEGFGIPILEGMASHVPVITTRGGVFTETGGDSCLFVDHQNHEEMACAINDLLSKKNLRQQIIERGRRHIEKFSEANVACNLKNVYEALI